MKFLLFSAAPIFYRSSPQPLCIYPQPMPQQVQMGQSLIIPPQFVAPVANNNAANRMLLRLFICVVLSFVVVAVHNNIFSRSGFDISLEFYLMTIENCFVNSHIGFVLVNGNTQPFGATSPSGQG